jgi:hypothetical protein
MEPTCARKLSRGEAPSIDLANFFPREQPDKRKAWSGYEKTNMPILYEWGMVWK